MQNGVMSVILVVDRSVAVEPSERRVRFVRRLTTELGSQVGTYIAYSDEARMTSLEDVTMDGVDYVYGSNLQHALLLARVACRTNRSTEVRLVTYNIPSAHHVAGKSFFMYPPIPDSLDAAMLEAKSCHSDGIRINTTLIVNGAEGDGGAELVRTFHALTGTTGGQLDLAWD
jgi:uncharacterized protein with von Willebrand factor type A (vWA) domain